MSKKDFTAIDAAIDAESWERLQEWFPSLASGIEIHVNKGATSDEVYRHVLRKTQRLPLALRCKQAAAFLINSMEL